MVFARLITRWRQPQMGANALIQLKRSGRSIMARSATATACPLPSLTGRSAFKSSEVAYSWIRYSRILWDGRKSDVKKLRVERQECAQIGRLTGLSRIRKTGLRQVCGRLELGRSGLRVAR